MFRYIVKIQIYKVNSRFTKMIYKFERREYKLYNKLECHIDDLPWRLYFIRIDHARGLLAMSNTQHHRVECHRGSDAPVGEEAFRSKYSSLHCRPELVQSSLFNQPELAQLTQHTDSRQVRRPCIDRQMMPMLEREKSVVFSVQSIRNMHHPKRETMSSLSQLCWLAGRPALTIF